MIGLMDCNNFFVSCERLFRPDLLRKPVIVLSSNDGCVVARSQEVKDLGIPMGIPYFEVEDVCKKNDVTIFSSNFALYRDISSRVMSALKSEYDVYEVYSVDEAFFEVDISVTAEELSVIRTRIMQKTGIPVSVGVASTKTLAKVANSIAKKQNVQRQTPHIMMEEGVCIMDGALWKKSIQELSCGSVWGIGRQTSAFLSTQNIHTVADLLAQDKAFIKNSLGVVGERLILELSGISVYTIGDVEIDDQQSYMSSRSFSTPIRDKLTLMSALGHHVSHVASKLRGDGKVASTMSIIVRGSRFGSFSHRDGSARSVFTVPTDDTFVLMKEAYRLLDTLYDTDIPYKKAGIVVGGVIPKKTVSDSLFSEFNAPEKTQKINTVVDFLNGKFGIGTIRSGVTMYSHKWQERKRYNSPEYTTQWSEIVTVKAR